jgi:PelA/Pel-15E family pectate lyase
MSRYLLSNETMWSTMKKILNSNNDASKHGKLALPRTALHFAALALSFLQIAFVLKVDAAVIGQMTPPLPLSPARIKELPTHERAAWSAYLDKSDEQRMIDKASLAAERANLAIIPGSPDDGNGAKSMPLNRAFDYYASLEARHIADVIQSFQTPAGGWGKNQPRNGELRKRGQSFVAHDKRGDQAGFAKKTDDWSYVGTIDNGATLTELRFLSRVSAALPEPAGEPYRDAIRRGVTYLLNAQYPNGGWPQVWPLAGDYHDAITFNDDALIDTVQVLSEVSSAPEFSFDDASIKARSAEAVFKAQALILRLQVKVNGVPTIWGQQHDVITEAACGARNFEPPSLSSAESANILQYLMSLNNPSPEIVKAIDHAKRFFQSSAISGFIWSKNPDPAIGNLLLPQPGAGPIWARYIDLKTLRPIFGDRDRSIHDDINEISHERRNGYAWFNTIPAKALNASSQK